MHQKPFSRLSSQRQMMSRDIIIDRRQSLKGVYFGPPLPFPEVNFQKVLYLVLNLHANVFQRKSTSKPILPKSSAQNMTKSTPIYFTFKGNSCV